MRLNKKAFTLVEMLVAMAVSSVIIFATYASFELIKQQYKKNMDIAELHSSGRAVMQAVEREVRMAGYEFRNANSVVPYGAIFSPIVITDSFDACCDEVTIIYDEVIDTVNAAGVVQNQVAQRVRTRIFTEARTTNKRGARNRLFRQRTILGRNNVVLGVPDVLPREVMADFIDDFQIENVTNSMTLYTGSNTTNGIRLVDLQTNQVISTWNLGRVSALTFDEDGFIYHGDPQNLAIDKIDTSSPTLPQVSTCKFFASGGVSALAYDRNRLYSGWVNSIQVFDIPTCAQVMTINNTGRVTAMTFDTLGQLYVGTDQNSNIAVMDPLIGTTLFTLSMANVSSALAMSSSGRLHRSGGNNGIEVVNPQTSVFFNNIQTTSVPSALAFDPNGLLYVGRQGSTVVEIFNPVTRARVGSVNTAGGVSALAFKNVKQGQENLVKINLTVRSRGEFGPAQVFTKREWLDGNFDYTFNDRFKRDTFSTTVSIRNL